MSDDRPPREPLLGIAGLTALARLRAWRLDRFLFSDDGRVGRRALWLFLSATMALAIVVFFSSTLRRTPWVHVAFGGLLIFPSYCVFAKRFQDIGASGVWAMAIVGISALDLVLAASGLKTNPGRIAPLMRGWEWIGLANMAVVFVILGLWPGNDGANRFGLREPPW